MAWTLDARVPVVFPDSAHGPGAEGGFARGGAAPVALVSLAPPPPLPGWAVAAVSFAAGATAHPSGCACCAGRSPAAQALDRLFQARARGACAWFDRVVVSPEAADEVRAALAADALSAARFRAA
jgi:hypothetical protein